MNNPDDPLLLQEAFKLFDTDGSGSITRGELKATLDNVMEGTGETLADEEIDEMIKEFDQDGDGARPHCPMAMCSSCCACLAI